MATTLEQEKAPAITVAPTETSEKPWTNGERARMAAMLFVYGLALWGTMKGFVFDPMQKADKVAQTKPANTSSVTNHTPPEPAHSGQE